MTEEEETSVVSALRTTKKDRSEIWTMRIVVIIRYHIRTMFGFVFADQCGHFADKYLSEIIHAYFDWVEYPKGDRDFIGCTDSNNHTASVISTDGHHFFSASKEGSITMWNLSEYSENQRWKAHEGYIECLAYSHGLLASSADDNEIKVWDSLLIDGRMIMICGFKGHFSQVLCLDFNSLGDHIVSGSNDKSIRIWSLKSGECIRIWDGHSFAVTSVYFIKDNDVLCAASDSCLRLWKYDCESSEFIRISDGIHKQVMRAFVNCDSSLVFAIHTRGYSVFKWPSMEIVRNSMDYVSVCSFHPSNPNVIAMDDHSLDDLIFSDDCEPSIKIHSLNDNRCLLSFDDAFDELVNLSWTHDGSRLIRTSFKGIKAWDISKSVDFMKQTI